MFKANVKRAIVSRSYQNVPKTDPEDNLQSQEDVDASVIARNSEQTSTTTQKMILLTVFIIASCVLAVWILITTNTPKFQSRPCTKPAVRREWRQLNNTEKSNYISAVKCRQTYPSVTTGVGRLSDDIPWVHRRMNQDSKSKVDGDRSSWLTRIQYTIQLYFYHGIAIFFIFTKDICKISVNTLESCRTYHDCR